LLIKFWQEYGGKVIASLKEKGTKPI